MSQFSRDLLLVLVVVSLVCLCLWALPPKPPERPAPEMSQAAREAWVEQTPNDRESMTELLVSRPWKTFTWEMRGEASDNNIHRVVEHIEVRFTRDGKLVILPDRPIGTWEYIRMGKPVPPPDGTESPPGRNFGEQKERERAEWLHRRPVLSIVCDHNLCLLDVYPTPENATKHRYGRAVPMVFRNGDTVRVEMHEWPRNSQWGLPPLYEVEAQAQQQLSKPIVVFTGDDPAGSQGERSR